MSDTNTITCPHCKADFPLGEAVSKTLRSELSAEFERERQRMNTALAERENLLAAGAAKLEAREKAVAAEIAQGLESGRAKLREVAIREAAENSSIAIRDLQEQLAHQNKRVEESQAAELEIRKKQRELEEAKATMELELVFSLLS
jgi:exonuclease VII large subunit